MGQTQKARCVRIKQWFLDLQIIVFVPQLTQHEYSIVNGSCGARVDHLQKGKATRSPYNLPLGLQYSPPELSFLQTILKIIDFFLGVWHQFQRAWQISSRTIKSSNIR